MLDAKTYNDLLLPLHNRMYILALRMLADSDEAMDAVQEVYLCLWEKRADISVAEGVEGFLATSVRNHCISRLRSRRNFLPAEAIAELPAPGTPLEYTEYRDRINHVAAYMDTLPPAQRQAIILRDIEGREMQEVEAALGVSAGNARTILSRARTALRKYFETE